MGEMKRRCNQRPEDEGLVLTAGQKLSHGRLHVDVLHWSI
jgi:hypothetical protein